MTDSERIATLTAELDEARELIRQLEHLMRGSGYRAPECLGLSPRETEILGLLVARESIRRDVLMMALYGHRSDPPGTGVLSVYLCRLRRKLAPHGLTIESGWGQGWRLTPEMKARLRALQPE